MGLKVTSGENKAITYYNIKDEKQTIFSTYPDKDYTKYLLILVVHILTKLKNKAALFPRYNNIKGICLNKMFIYPIQLRRKMVAMVKRKFYFLIQITLLQRRNKDGYSLK